jgi:hypothetical protein
MNATTVIPLCSINMQQPQYGFSSQGQPEQQSSGRIYLLQRNQNKVLSDLEFDTENRCLCFSQFSRK